MTPPDEADREAVARRKRRLAPKGWRLVPLNPTPAMVEAADDEHGSWRRQPTTEQRYTWLYHAMLSAAPEPPQPEGRAGG